MHGFNIIHHLKYTIGLEEIFIYLINSHAILANIVNGALLKTSFLEWINMWNFSEE